MKVGLKSFGTQQKSLFEQLFKEAECINSDSLNPCTKILAATHIHQPLTMGIFY